MWIKRFVTFFGAGLSPKAPGTMGTLAALPLALGLSLAGPFIYMVFTVILFIVAVWACEQYQNQQGGHDRQEIVIDEVVGLLITMTWMPMTWQAFALGFVLFRLLDIFKPFPIGLIDKRVKGGLGVMADDVVAGIIASIIMQIIYTKTMWLGAQIL